MNQFCRLVSDGLNHLGVAMSRGGDCNARGKIQIGIIVHIGNGHPPLLFLRPMDKNVCKRRRHFFHPVSAIPLPWVQAGFLDVHPFLCLPFRPP